MLCVWRNVTPPSCFVVRRAAPARLSAMHTCAGMTIVARHGGLDWSPEGAAILFICSAVIAYASVEIHIRDIIYIKRVIRALVVYVPKRKRESRKRKGHRVKLGRPIRASETIIDSKTRRRKTRRKREKEWPPHISVTEKWSEQERDSLERTYTRSSGDLDTHVYTHLAVGSSSIVRAASDNENFASENHAFLPRLLGWLTFQKQTRRACNIQRERDRRRLARWLAGCASSLSLSLSPSLRPHFPPSTARACCVPFCAIVTPFLRWPTLRGCLAAIRGVESRGERKRNESNRGETKTIVRLPSRAPPSTFFTDTHRTSCILRVCVYVQSALLRRGRGARGKAARPSETDDAWELGDHGLLTVNRFARAALTSYSLPQFRSLNELSRSTTSVVASYLV